MAVVIQAAVRLQPGCKLYYHCPILGDTYKSNQFFQTHSGKVAEFVRYDEDLVGVLDHKGRRPGRYINFGAIRVRFEGEEEISLNLAHFVVMEAAKATLVDFDRKPEYLGELPYPILFYPGDHVWVKGQPDFFSDEQHEVVEVFVGNDMFAPGGIPRYQVMETAAEHIARVMAEDEENERRPLGSRTLRHHYAEPQGTNMSGDKLELARSGNVRWLYTDPSKLSFESDEKELAFWLHSGVSWFIPTEVRATYHRPRTGELLSARNKLYFSEARDIFEDGTADLVCLDLNGRTERSFTRDEVWYVAKRLHDCFAEHRPRVRALMEKALQAHTAELV